MSERLSDERLRQIMRLNEEVEASLAEAEQIDPESPYPDLGSWHVTDNVGRGEIEALVVEVRERRAAEQRVRDVLREWDKTEPEDGWGRMAEEITAALDA